MKKGFLEGALMVAVAFALFMAGVFAAALIKNPPTNSGDWATWTGAFFTGLAFAGTIWLATSQERKRRENELNVARLVAAKISTELEAVLRDATRLEAQLFVDDESLTGFWRHMPNEIFPSQANTICDVSVLSILSALPYRTAYCIARATGLLQSTSADMRRCGDFRIWEKHNPATQRMAIDQWRYAIHESRELLMHAILVCENAANSLRSTHQPFEIISEHRDIKA